MGKKKKKPGFFLNKGDWFSKEKKKKSFTGLFLVPTKNKED